jgi:hypothetical protein
MKLTTSVYLSLAFLLLLGSASVGLAQSPPPVSFPVSISYTVGSVPNSVGIGDFNHDGYLDLAVTEGNNNVAVLLGNGDGTFQPEMPYAVGSTPASIAVGDFNGDGCPDLAVANLNGTATDQSISVLLNKCDGSGQFVVSSFVVPTTYPRFIAVGDFNGDGNLDLAVADFNGTVWVVLGNGDGTFGTAKSYTLGSADSGEYSVAVGDFNADGYLDLAVTTGNGVDVLLGNGDGTFKSPVNYSVGTTPFWVAVGDFNADGHLDLAVATGNGVDVLLGNGDGTFKSPVNYAAGGEPFSVAVGDFNNDGNLDLAVADGYPSAVSVLLGNGNGTFQAPVYFAAGNTPNSVAVGAFTGHSLDLVETNDADATLRVMLNETPAPVSPTNLSQQFVFNSTTSQYLAFNLDYTTAYNTNSDLTIEPDTLAMVSNPGVTQANYTTMVAGTSLATTTCYIAPAEGTDSNSPPNPLCAEITLTCTNATPITGLIPAGDNCPQSLARNLYWANSLETSTDIVGTTPSIPAGSAPTLGMGSDTWSPGNCTFVGPETGSLCPQSMLTQFIELSSDTKIRGGGTGGTSNSTYILGCCEPEWNTVATVPAWSSTLEVPVSFAGTPPTAPALPNNNWVAAPNQSVTWGWEALGAAPDPTYPIPGDQTVINSTACPSAWPPPGTTPADFTASGSVTVNGPGLYEVHYFSTACDNQEELLFNVQTPGTTNWAAFKTVSFGVDTTAPTVTNLTLSTGAIPVAPYSTVTASFTCTDPSGNGVVASGLAGCGNQLTPTPGSGPAGPAAPSPGLLTETVTGFPVPTSTLGPQMLTVYATDLAGNNGSASVSYQVVGSESSVSPPSINFGTVYLGTVTVKSVTVTNVGNAPMTISTPFISILSGGNSKEFVAVSLCPKSLAVEKSCTIYVNFVAGPFYTPQTAMLYVADNAYGSPQTVALSATVINPQAWLSATSLSFGTVKVGGPGSTAKVVTLKNPGATPLTINSIAIAGADPNDFTQTNTCLSPANPSGTLASGASCTISVTFTPKAKGSRSASVMITDNAQDSPQKISLSGTGA